MTDQAAIWVVRTGRRGEYEERFLEESRIYLTWDELNDLTPITSREALNDEWIAKNCTYSIGSNHRGQIWSFRGRIEKGELVYIPSKKDSTVHAARVTGDYQYDRSESVGEYQHYRTIEWVKKDIPRASFPKDLLYSLNGGMAIFQVTRNDAAKRLPVMLEKLDTIDSDTSIVATHEEIDEASEIIDAEEVKKDSLEHRIAARYKGHAMEALVDSILRAKGYVTHRSPVGPDKGVDLLVTPGPMGLGEPRICVQVKSGDDKQGRPVLNQLMGAMTNFNATQGLLVSWGGFTSEVEKERADHFFNVRLWNRKDLIEEVLENYDKLDEDIREQLPLKRIWVLDSNAIANE